MAFREVDDGLWVESLNGKFESLLIIHSSTEEEANNRGGWFIHKCKNAKVAGYFWVKSTENAHEPIGTGTRG